MTTRARRVGRSPVVAYVAVIAVLMFGMARYQASITDAIHRQQLEGCRRGKLDRTANASAFRAQSDYLNLVLQADSVQADVKRAARVNQAAQDRAASSLESRTGDRLNCAQVFSR